MATVQIVTDSNVTLLCGTNGELRLLVSSHALSMNSTVFKVMLGPQFLEGFPLAASAHVEIPLPEDDPKAMELLCQALHSRASVAELIEHALLLKIARLTDKTKIIVSSAILRQGSAVFNTMLAPKFKEGTFLAAFSQVDIPLPDDDCEALITLCKLLHLHDIVKEKQSPNQILQLAILADKYDCCGVLRVIYGIWVNDALQQERGLDDNIKLFVASFCVKLAAQFRTLGVTLLLDFPSDISLAVAGDCAGRLDYVADALSAQRRKFTAEITDLVERIVKQELEGKAIGSAVHDCRHTCRYLLRRSSSFGAFLFCEPTWPLSLASLRPLRLFTTKFHNMKGDAIALEIFCGGYGGKACRGGALAGIASVFAEFKALVKKIEDESIRLCLNCVKGGYVQSSGGCEKGH
ncbi:Putative SKP1/BTB/POZ domain superfamily protein [Septoria linicola]|uniref:SKP1/BTB/POZ domain superfamily protein n=1 Tax=Septoria linicola TaxID=215465 RepID=A0A9Q9EM50_9PEZI|nr:Putative SKP1/BTB/POZ domain superfamily protein [Septoria linicola]